MMTFNKSKITFITGFQVIYRIDMDICLVIDEDLII